MSHTPGPWRVIVNPVRGVIVKGPNGVIIASRPLCKEWKRNEELYANARLIAAAPEMYEALEELRDKVWRIIDLHRDSEARAEANMALERANAALAKARGDEGEENA